MGYPGLQTLVVQKVLVLYLGNYLTELSSVFYEGFLASAASETTYMHHKLCFCLA